jgi:hypothetical protein
LPAAYRYKSTPQEQEECIIASTSLKLPSSEVQFPDIPDTLRKKEEKSRDPLGDSKKFRTEHPSVSEKSTLSIDHIPSDAKILTLPLNIEPSTLSRTDQIVPTSPAAHDIAQPPLPTVNSPIVKITTHEQPPLEVPIVNIEAASFSVSNSSSEGSPSISELRDSKSLIPRIPRGSSFLQPNPHGLFNMPADRTNIAHHPQSSESNLKRPLRIGFGIFLVGLVIGVAVPTVTALTIGKDETFNFLFSSDEGMCVLGGYTGLEGLLGAGLIALSIYWFCSTHEIDFLNESHPAFREESQVAQHEGGLRAVSAADMLNS